MCRLYIFVLDSHLATLWESNCPFGFPLVMFPLGSVYFVFVFLSLCFSDGRCGIIVSVPDHFLPFYFETVQCLTSYLTSGIRPIFHTCINKVCL